MLYLIEIAKLMYDIKYAFDVLTKLFINNLNVLKIHFLLNNIQNTLKCVRYFCLSCKMT